MDLEVFPWQAVVVVLAVCRGRVLGERAFRLTEDLYGVKV
jgi:hypothetical protein